MTKEDTRARGVLVLATIGAIGFGVWVESIGAGVFAWAILVIVLARMSR